MDSFFLALNGTGIEMDRPVYPADGSAILILSALRTICFFLQRFAGSMFRCWFVTCALGSSRISFLLVVLGFRTGRWASFKVLSLVCGWDKVEIGFYLHVEYTKLSMDSSICLGSRCLTRWECWSLAPVSDIQWFIAGYPTSFNLLRFVADKIWQLILTIFWGGLWLEVARSLFLSSAFFSRGYINITYFATM